jgi:germination protein M
LDDQNLGQVVTQSETIALESPQPNAVVARPLTVSGQARTFEQTVNVRLLQEDGVVLAEEFTTATAAVVGQFGPYQLTLEYRPPTTQSGILEVYEVSAEDGSEINKVRIPVRFQQR